MKWEDINTAPKDGSPILGWNTDRKCAEVVYWRNDDYWCSDGYYLAKISDNILGYDLSISHWMQLPENP